MKLDITLNPLIYAHGTGNSNLDRMLDLLNLLAARMEEGLDPEPLRLANKLLEEGSSLVARRLFAEGYVDDDVVINIDIQGKKILYELEGGAPDLSIDVGGRS